MSKKIISDNPVDLVSNQPSQELVISRRHFLTTSTKKGALMMLAARSGILLGGTGFIPKVTSVAHANPFWIIAGRALWTFVRRVLYNVAVTIATDVVVNAITNQTVASRNNIQRVTQQVNAGGYTYVDSETFIMSGTAQNPTSYAYLAGHKDNTDCCIVFVNQSGGNPIYLNGAMAVAFVHIHDNWATFRQQNPTINTDIRSTILPNQPSMQQSLHSGFDYNYPSTKVYSTNAGAVHTDYKLIAPHQGELTVSIYHANQRTYWDKFVVEFD